MYGYYYRLVSLGGFRFAVSPGVSERAVAALVPHMRKAFSRRDVMQKWLPPMSAAALLGVSRRQIERLIEEKRLKVAILSDETLWPKDRKVWILRSSLDEYARARYSKGVGREGEQSPAEGNRSSLAEPRRRRSRTSRAVVRRNASILRGDGLFLAD